MVYLTWEGIIFEKQEIMEKLKHVNNYVCNYGLILYNLVDYIKRITKSSTDGNSHTPI